MQDRREFIRSIVAGAAALFVPLPRDQDVAFFLDPDAIARNALELLKDELVSSRLFMQRWDKQ